MRRVAFAILSTIAGLIGLLTFKTESVGTTVSSAAVSTTNTGTSPTALTAPTSSASSASRSASSSASSPGSNSATPTSTKKRSTKTAPATKTVTGDVIETQYGPVQVKITVTGAKVTAATAVQYPNGDPRSQQINAYAVPILEKETVGISSASSVDTVSGATYTSDGYLQSLQAALDRAGL